MKIIKKFFVMFFGEIGIIAFMISMFLALVIHSHNSEKYEVVCFPKSQFTELEKSIKTNKLLRGTYNDL